MANKTDVLTAAALLMERVRAFLAAL